MLSTKRSLLISLLALLLPGYAAAAQCADDTIKSVSSEGEILVMFSGAVYKVDQFDRLDSELWLPADDVLICDDGRMINTDENGEVVSVQRLN